MGTITVKKYFRIFIVSNNETCQGKVLETEQMIVDYCNENKLKITKGLENLSEENQKKLENQE